VRPLELESPTPLRDHSPGFAAPWGLRARGLKILLELPVRTPHLRVTGVPFTFAERYSGHSKVSWREAAWYQRQLAALRLAAAGRVGRLVRFAVVGGSEVVVNLLVGCSEIPDA